MQCSKCSKTDWITIGNRAYCVYCGTTIGAGAKKPEPLVLAQKTEQPTKTADLTVRPTINDVASRRSNVVNLRPANSFHSGPASNGVIDLRAPKSPEPVAPTAPVTSSKIEPETKTEVKAKPEPKSVEPVKFEKVQPKKRKSERLTKALSVSRNQLVQKFPKDKPAPALVQPTEARPSELPADVASQIEAMSRMIGANVLDLKSAKAKDAKSPLRIKLTGIAATMLAITIMGGYIWLGNYDNLTLKTAASKAGIEVSMPNYVPNNYSLAGPITYGPGNVTFEFKALGIEDPISITQRKSNWNTAALLEFYVAGKSKSYTSVRSQGLTIYLFDNTATWVNRGLQYVVKGNGQVSGEQLLKIVESL